MKSLSIILLFCLCLFYGSALAYFGNNIPYAVETSSSLKGRLSYEASNLLEIGSLRGWCTDKYGRKDVWVKIKPDHPLQNSFQIFILPGYTKSNKLFYANSRPKKIMLLGKNRKGDEILSNILELQDKPQMQSFMVLLKDASHDVAELMLTVIDVYTGNKYEDLCITEIKLCMVPHEKMTYQEKSDMQEKEIRVIKESIKDIESGDFNSVVNLFRLTASLYYKTAEGGEWLDELYLDYFVKKPDRYLFLLSREEEGVKSRVEKALLAPVMDKYDDNVLSKALIEAIKKGILKDDYPELVKKYIK